jgi:cytochrome c-type biogenesis protein CcmH/NrfG
MNDQPDHLPFKVEQWDDTGTQVTSVLARTANHAIAQSAFIAAIRLHPSRIVTLRHGARVLQISGDTRRVAFKSNSIGSVRRVFTCA